MVQLVSPGWDAVARRKAIADAEACGKVWDGKFTMVPMPGNPGTRMPFGINLRVVGRGASGMVK